MMTGVSIIRSAVPAHRFLLLNATISGHLHQVILLKTPSRQSSRSHFGGAWKTRNFPEVAKGSAPPTRY